jgi:phosphatidate cytidylyltransferase
MNLLARTVSTGVLWATILGVIVADWLPGYYLIIPALGGIGIWEFYKAMELRGVRVFKKSGTVAGVVFLLGSIYILSGAAPSWLDFITFEVMGLIVLMLGILSRQVFDRSQPTPVVSMAVTLFGLLYVVWLFSFVVHVRFFPIAFPGVGEAGREGALLLIYLLVVAKMHDAGALLTGKIFGRHKMIPKLSPRKTWEGFVGGLVVAMASSVLLVALFPQELLRVGPVWCWPLGLLLGLLSVVGDLAESVVKRDSHMKDSGHVIPGIGGVLDLIDSILFSAPIFYLYLKAQFMLTGGANVCGP